MAQVRLTKAWTDAQGTVHAAGATVDVDDGTQDQLKRSGIADPSWIGPTGGGVTGGGAAGATSGAGAA